MIRQCPDCGFRYDPKLRGKVDVGMDDEYLDPLYPEEDV